MTEFVTTPTDAWLKSEIGCCAARLLVSSPYVGGWLPALHGSLPKSVRSVLLTRVDLRDFASGASDLKAVCALASRGTEIICSHRLHAKVYVIDEVCGLITSANATFSGMQGNLECGVVVRDLASVRRAADLVLSGFEAQDAPRRWKHEELDALQEPVRRLQENLTAKLIASALEDRVLPNVDPTGPVGSSLLEHLPGWTRLALEGVQRQPETFSLDSFVAACGPMVAARYPANRHVRPKLRQQLQCLRDLGLIEFLGGGTYRRSTSR